MQSDLTSSIRYVSTLWMFLLLLIVKFFLICILFQHINPAIGSINDSIVPIDATENNPNVDANVDASAASADVDVDVDAAAVDAVEEDEDNIDIASDEDTDTPEEANQGILNNDFCFSEADFLNYQTSMNDATRHQSKHSLAWDVIKNLTDEEVKCSSSGDGNLTWKVVERVYDDELQKIRIEEEFFFQRGCL